MKRVKVLFRINDEVVVEESGDITHEQIERLKWNIVLECEVFYDMIDVEIIHLPVEFGDIDVGSTGMYDYTDCYFKVKSGVNLSIKEGSDEYLEALTKGTLEDYLIFI